ncbi:aldehyde dehydrogenase (NADP(+)) [Sphingobacterium sp. SRCM116780]|uniref:aldehyde dehydrogenase (NADP(+)) n=1 Tax=Sphingobacterium sp. SRCM116780 TaxID=2907623 RepID=UPI001F3BDF32|nr:aldehyde dehydrogenase (NADP(+)) [Sphingobacterium sp. SRCM116780]UIR54644.1 aldehyde dehydrogenase (NADP(+)) [Sphingobacterium sp. SRCM116780]
MMRKEWTANEIDLIAQQSESGFRFLQQLNSDERAKLMHLIADEIEVLDEALIEVAEQETALALGRLQGEKARTVNQWRRYANAVKTGLYSEARLDVSEDGQMDLRKYNKGLGPVVVFGASNFPFAFSTAGGDTASAIGAGCSVIVKAHPGHVYTSQMMAEKIHRALEKYGAPKDVFTHVIGDSFELGQRLVQHPLIKAVAFTGSFKGGKALFDLGQTRPDPIPVFAEMGSVNPVFALPDFMTQHAETFAKQYVSSLVLGTGQFCTNPGILIALAGQDLQLFKEGLKSELSEIPPTKMLHAGILANFQQLATEVTQQEGVQLIAKGKGTDQTELAQAAIYETSSTYFLNNPKLAEEVFGPFGLIVSCSNKQELLTVLNAFGGQLTITFSATEQDIESQQELFQLAQEKCGRLLFQGMPTGVEVQYAIQHGGPFPATTDTRFTSVGPDAVKRFLRPVSFQNWPNTFLPDELKNENPLQIDRLVNQQWSKNKIIK